MKITHFETFSPDKILARLKKTPLRGYGGVEIYLDASLELVEGADPGSFVPAQRYVLESDIRNIKVLQDALLALNLDIFGLRGGVRFHINPSEEEPVHLIPPIIEESSEPGGETVLLINDGMHRLYTARKVGREVSVILARNVPRQYPYYAYALSNGWSSVEELDELPDGYLRKSYRDPTSYRSLFRDFNAVLPGVQKQRRKTDPPHLHEGEL